MKRILILLYLSLLIGCNNWSENPIEEKYNITQTPTTVSGSLEEIKLPTKASTLAVIDGKYFTGTSDGEVYLNTSLNSPPILKCTIPNAKINCFFKYTDYSASPYINYLLIGTDKGLYYTNELGDNLMPLFVKSTKTNEYIQVTCIDQVKVDSKTYELNVFGYDGQYNAFISKDFGGTWIYSANYKGFVKSRINFQTTRKIGSGTSIVQLYLTGCEESSSSYIINNLSLLDYKINGKIYSFIYNSNDKICYCVTSNGIYKSIGDNIINNSWEQIAFNGCNVYSMVCSSYGTLFASTNIGVYRSNDGGTSWIKLDVSFNTITTYFFQEYQLSPSIIIITSESSYRGNDLKKDNIYDFSPILIYPENNSIISSNKTQLIWQSISNISGNNYLLQVSKKSDFSAETINIKAGCNLTYTIDNLDKNTKYYWRVKSFNIFGSTNYSSPSYFTTGN